MIKNTKQNIKLKPHQIEDIYIEDEHRPFRKIPRGLRLVLYGSIIAIILFVCLSFIIKFQFYKEIYGVIDSVNSEASSVKIRISGSQPESFSKLNESVILAFEIDSFVGEIKNIEYKESELILSLIIQNNKLISIKKNYKLQSLIKLRIPIYQKTIIEILFEI